MPESTMTYEQLLEAHRGLRRFLHKEIAIREALAQKRPYEREKWIDKTAEARRMLINLEILTDYIAAQNPAETLPREPKQQELI